MTAAQKKDRRIARSALAVMTLCIVGVLGSMMLFAGSASAKKICDPYTHKCKTISPTHFTRSPHRHTSPAPTHRPSPSPSVLHKTIEPQGLPFTGADVTLFVLTGLAAIGIGMVIVRRTRARKLES